MSPDGEIRSSPRSGPARCPYCHDTCLPQEFVDCSTCQARHHAECWDEFGACSSCGAGSEGQRRRPVTPARLRRRVTRDWRTGGVLALQTVVLALCTLVVALGSAEGPVFTGLGTLLVCLFVLLVSCSTRRVLGLLLVQLALTVGASAAVAFLIESLDLSPSDPSLALAAVGAALTLASRQLTYRALGVNAEPSNPEPGLDRDPPGPLK